MDWKKAIPRGVKETTTELYVNSRDDRKWTVDCGLGSSPVGAPEGVKRSFLHIFGEDLSNYVPPADRLSEPVCRYWNGLVSPEELAFANGTDTIIVVLAKALGAPEGTVLGMAPQFTDAPVHFQLSGCKFRPVRLEGPSFRIRKGPLLDALDEGVSLVYLDRPHNPTGQLMELEDLDDIVMRAQEVGALVIVDEAYGDFVPDEESCLHLDRENIVCLRSFSKGWGMAGIRGGYAVFRSGLARDLYLRVSPPFTVDALAFAAIPQALDEADTFLPLMREEVRRLKGRVMDLVSSTPGFSVAETCMSVSIMMVTFADPSVNLYDLLMDHGIRTAPGSGFLGIGDNSVRLRVPPERDTDRFVENWKAMAKELAAASKHIPKGGSPLWTKEPT